MLPYSSTLADHFHSPRNAGEMDSPDAVGRASLDGRAPYVTIFLAVESGVVTQAMFQTFGCGYSIAACSALTVIVQAMTLQECLTIREHDLVSALDGMPPHKTFCAQLAIDALQDALTKLATSGSCPT